MFITKDLFVVAQNARFEPMQGNEMFPNALAIGRACGGGAMVTIRMPNILLPIGCAECGRSMAKFQRS